MAGMGNRINKHFLYFLQMPGIKCKHMTQQVTPWSCTSVSRSMSSFSLLCLNDPKHNAAHGHFSGLGLRPPPPPPALPAPDGRRRSLIGQAYMTWSQMFCPPNTLLLLKMTNNQLFNCFFILKSIIQMFIPMNGSFWYNGMCHVSILTISAILYLTVGHQRGLQIELRQNMQYLMLFLPLVAILTSGLHKFMSYTLCINVIQLVKKCYGTLD